MIKVVIFDFDGVIAESLDIKTKAFAELFQKENKNARRKIVDYHLRNLGVSRYEKFKHIYTKILKRPLGKNEFKMLCAEFSGLVRDKVIAAAYVKGAKEFLQRYAHRYRCFVLSATPKQELGQIIRERKIRHFFKAVYGTPDDKPVIVRKILAEEKARPKEAVYIGDSLSDYRAARANSVRFIARIKGKGGIFRNINCPKIRDLTRLQEKLRIISEDIGNN